MSDIRIYYEDGINAPIDEHGNEAVKMDVDDEAFPLGNITNYNTYVVIDIERQSSMPKIYPHQKPYNPLRFLQFCSLLIVFSLRGRLSWIP
ncbi:hypothetical protein G6F42_014826 [Rhizopus arrhizus]|nr:hypothetical protein G6F42_014826 [Rhizopus arrhizus]